MNNSNVKVFSFLLIFVAACSLVIARYGVPCMVTGSGFCADAQLMYAKAIDSEMVTDWHSSFCMYEAILLKRILDWFFDANAFYAMSILFYASYCCFIGSLCAWFYMAYKKGMSIIIPAIFSLLAITCLCRYCSFSLDFAFVGCASLSITLIALYRFLTLGRIWRILLVLLILLTFVHIVALRRNAVFIIPFLSYAMVTYHHHILVKRIQRFAVACAIAFLAYFFATSFVALVLPVKTSHPMCVMMASEMRMVAILNGEVNKQGNEYVRAQRNQYSLIQDSECGGDMIVLYQWYAKPDAFDVDQTERWNKLKRLYVDGWINQPCDYLIARGISISQFLYGAQTPPLVKRAIEKIYPAVRENKSAWEYKEGRSWVTPLKAIYHLGIICAAVVSALCVWSRARRARRLNPIEVIVALTGGISILYLLSFFVVTPSPDRRYIAPSVSLAYISFAFFLEQMRAKYAHVIVTACFRNKKSRDL